MNLGAMDLRLWNFVVWDLEFGIELLWEIIYLKVKRVYQCSEIESNVERK